MTEIRCPLLSFDQERIVSVDGYVAVVQSES